MTSIAETPLARLETERRLINAGLSEAGTADGSFLFRGELAITLSPKGGKNPPDLKAEQVLITSLASQPALPFVACSLATFASLKPLVEVLGSTLGASGKYFAFCSDLPANANYRVNIGAGTFFVYPLEKKGSVFAELLLLLNIDPESVKKRSLKGKLEALLDEVVTFNPSNESITYERGLELMKAA
jgi:hypothetical protein